MRIIIIIAFALISNIGYSQCDISVQDLVKKINCDSLIAQCPVLGIDEIGIIEDLDLAIDCINQEMFLSIDVGGVQESTTQDISCFFDNTDTQLTEAQVDAFVANNGYITSVPLNPTYEDELHLLGYAFVNANGSISSQSGGFTVVRLSVGRYQYTYAGAEYFTASTVETFAARDDIRPHAETFVGDIQYFSEQDNGGTAGVLRDRPHRVEVFGLKSVLTNVTISN